MSRNLIYIGYAGSDEEMARGLVGGLERLGLSCWFASRDTAPGASWGVASNYAIEDCLATVALLTSATAVSAKFMREIAHSANMLRPIFVVEVGDVQLNDELRRHLVDAEWYSTGPDGIAEIAEVLAQAVRAVLPELPEAPEEPLDALPTRTDRIKGYVFISYVRGDAGFVEKLRKVFELKKYGYWDYEVGNRDYHGVLYKELEERIDGAAAFMTVVSDAWRSSDWVASEFIYAREADKPIFVLQAEKLKRSLPILLNLQTRIDMHSDFERGCEVLAEELDKKGL